MSLTSPRQAASHLTTLSQQLRSTSLLQEMTTQAQKAKDLSQPQLEVAKDSFGAARQVVLQRMLKAIDQCDIVQAEAALREALTFSARLQGLEQGTVSQ